MIGELLFIIITRCMVICDFIKTNIDAFLSILTEKIMWSISKCQIYISRIRIPNFFKKNRMIVEFFNSENLCTEYLTFEITDTTANIQKVYSDHTRNVCKQTVIYDYWSTTRDNSFSVCDKSLIECAISNYIPKDFKFYIISNSQYNINCANYRIEMVWKGLDNIFLEPKEVSFIFSPILMEITYPDIEPIQFLLSTNKYNYFLVGNILNKHFFAYFFKKYYSDKVRNKSLDTYKLFVIDYNFKRFYYTEKDEFTITQDTQLKDGIETTKFNIFQ